MSSNRNIAIKPSNRDKKITVAKRQQWSGSKMVNQHHALNLSFTLYHSEGKNAFGHEIACHAVILLVAEKIEGEWYLYLRAPINKGCQMMDDETYELAGPIFGGAKEVRKMMREYAKGEWTWDAPNRELTPPQVEGSLRNIRLW